MLADLVAMRVTPEDAETISDNGESVDIEHVQNPSKLLAAVSKDPLGLSPSEGLYRSPIAEPPQSEIKIDTEKRVSILNSQMTQFFEGDDTWEESEEHVYYALACSIFLPNRTNVDDPQQSMYRQRENMSSQANTLKPKRRTRPNARHRRKAVERRLTGCVTSATEHAIIPQITQSNLLTPVGENKMDVKPKSDMVEAMDQIDEGRVIDWIRECEAPVVNLMDDNIKLSGPPLEDFTDIECATTASTPAEDLLDLRDPEHKPIVAQVMPERSNSSASSIGKTVVRWKLTIATGGTVEIPQKSQNSKHTKIGTSLLHNP